MIGQIPLKRVSAKQAGHHRLSTSSTGVAANCLALSLARCSRTMICINYFAKLRPLTTQPPRNALTWLYSSLEAALIRTAMVMALTGFDL